MHPYLSTRRPSPTTIEYTVSTYPSTPSVPFLLLQVLTTTLRLVTACSVGLVLYAALERSSYSPYRTGSSAALSSPSTSDDVLGLLTTGINHVTRFLHLVLTTTRAGHLSAHLAGRTPSYLLYPGCAALLLLTSLRSHVTESLLVLRGLGIQTSTSANTYLTTAATRFIPTEKVQDIFVNEAFRGFEVRYLLVVVVSGEEDVVVVFPRLLPKRVVVETVWRGCRRCLYEPDKIQGK